MAKQYGNRSVCVCDTGIFISIAQVLAKSFGKVWYHSPWISRFPTSNQLMIGTGLPGITRCDDPYTLLNDPEKEPDLWVFPDIHWGEFQCYLESQGKRVWGSRRGEHLEMYRVPAKEHLKSLGLHIGNYTVLKGLDALREHLKSHKRQYVKISRTRGDAETFFAESYKLIEPQLNDLEHHLGPLRHSKEFIVEDEIKDAVPNLGMDAYTVNGDFPKRVMCGIEVKEKCYVGKVMNYVDMPEQIQQANAAIAPTLRGYDYRNFWTLEMVMDKVGRGWIIDPVARVSSPPGELCGLMYKNLAEIFWEGAGGNLVEPEFAGKYGVELLLTSDWADKNWQPVYFPEEYADNIRFHNFCKVDGTYHTIPQSVRLLDPVPESRIGAIYAVGDTPAKAAEWVRTIAKEVKGYYIETHTEALDHVEEKIKELKEVGITL